MTPSTSVSARFDWQWTSRTGLARRENRDAAGIVSRPAYTIAIIIDASSRGRRGAAFNETWIRATLSALGHEMPSPTQTMRAMQSAQKTLRSENFSKESASYAALVLSHIRNEVYGLFCGDCRIGHQAVTGETIWLTQPHTAANLVESGIELQHLSHIVTRTLKVQRFIEPEYVRLDAKHTNGWVLATDGHHRDSIEREKGTDDDRSFIFLERGCRTQVASDAENLYVL